MDDIQMKEIDSISGTILRELLKDGRKSLTEIAKECGTSKDVIAKRYKQMKLKGIIVGATIQNSYVCSGCNNMASISINTLPGKTGHVVKLIRNMPQTREVFYLGAKPSLTAWMALKTIEDLDPIRQSIEQLPFVSGVETRIWTGIRTTPENLSIFPLEETNLKIDEPSRKKDDRIRKNTKIDEVDMQIAEKLALNGRKPFRKIAEELNISTDTVSRRYERLKRNGDLKAVIQINPTKIGYSALAIFNVALISEESLFIRVEAIAKIPDVNFILKSSGRFDFKIGTMIRDVKQLLAIQEEIAGMPGVTNIEVEVAKPRVVWPPKGEIVSTF